MKGIPSAARQEEILNDIASKKSFLGALGAAEPSMGALLARGLQLLDRLGVAADKVATLARPGYPHLVGK